MEKENVIICFVFSSEIHMALGQKQGKTEQWNK